MTHCADPLVRTEVSPNDRAGYGATAPLLSLDRSNRFTIHLVIFTISTFSIFDSRGAAAMHSSNLFKLFREKH